MPDAAVLWDLVIDGRVEIEHLAAAVDAYLAAPATRRHPLGPDHIIDLAAAVAAHPRARAAMADTDADHATRRGAVRAALLLVVPTRR